MGKPPPHLNVPCLPCRVINNHVITDLPQGRELIIINKHLIVSTVLCIQVRSAGVSWRETRNALHKDHRWRLAKLLSTEEKEKLFEEHVEVKGRKSREIFYRLLNETPSVTLTSTWKDIKLIIK